MNFAFGYSNETEPNNKINKINYCCNPILEKSCCSYDINLKLNWESGKVTAKAKPNETDITVILPEGTIL